LKNTFAIMAAASLLVLAGCGSNKSAQTAAPFHRSESAVERNALPLSRVARMPRGLHCRRDQVVWVNMSSKTIHEAGDPFYGRTRRGEYMCVRDAEAQGYHMAGARHSMRGSGYGDSGAMSDQSSYGTHRRHRRPAEPMDTPTP